MGENRIEKCLVTGSSGFLGSHIINRLVQMKTREIIACDCLEPEIKFPTVHYQLGDILDKEKLISLTKGVDCIFHAAALVPLAKAGKRFIDVNVQGTQNVLECCEENKVGMMIFISSSAIYGKPEDVPITAKTPYKPFEDYGRSKLQAEELVWEYMKRGGDAACIRPRTIIGGEGRLGIFQILFEWIYNNKKVFIIGDGSNCLQFVHVKDLIDAVIQSALKRKSGLFNIGALEFGTLREDLQGLIAFAGKKSRIISIPVPLAEISLTILDFLRLSPLTPWHYHTFYNSFVFDIAKVQKELNWTPRYSNLTALQESYSWYEDNRVNLKHHKRSIHRMPVKQRLLNVVRWFS